MEFIPFPKIARLNRDCTITEKLDGTNAQIHITEEGDFFVGSRTRWITPEADNFGFARWAHANKEELLKLGPGSHFGEWWGVGIQRGYHLSERRFSLFNAKRWADPSVRPACCDVVPLLYEGRYSADAVESCVHMLRTFGSKAALGFPAPEGVVLYLNAARVPFKVLLENDDQPKGAAE